MVLGICGSQRRAAHIVDDLGSGGRCGAGDAGFVSVNGNHRIGAQFLELGNHRQHAARFLFLAQGNFWSSSLLLWFCFLISNFLRWRRDGDAGSGTGGFSANVNDVGAFLE
jgi:hypothetical protein